MKQLLACVVIISFVITTHGPLPLYAQTSAVSADLSSAGLPADLNTVSIPEEIGKVQEINQAAGCKPALPAGRPQAASESLDLEACSQQLVVLIQDAHAIPDAQRNIQKIIQHFQEKYGVNQVALEGASSQLDSQIFQSFPDKEKLQQVFQEYFDQGELAGGTAAAIFSDKGVYHGIEDWALYEEGLAFYQRAIIRESEILKKLAAWSLQLEAKKKKIYSKELLEVDQALADFQANRINLTEVLEQLSKKGTGSNSQPVPFLSDELALLLQESRKTDNHSIELEVKRMAEKVKKQLQAASYKPQKDCHLKPEACSLKQDILARFNQKYQEFKTSQITPEAFALWMENLVTPVTFSKELTQLIHNQKRLQDIQGTKLFKDFEVYAKSVKEALFQNDEQRKLDARNRELELLEKLTKLELSREEWNEVQGTAYSVRSEEEWKNHFAFYENAQKRDEIFFNNLVKVQRTGDSVPRESKTGLRSTLPTGRQAQNAVHSTILVAGGFHTEGLTQRFKDAGISYILITPSINKIPEQTNYQAHMRGDVSWKDYFEVENGKVNLYKAFVRGTRDKLIGHQTQDTSHQRQPLVSGDVVPGDLLKRWRDQIIRDLADKNEIAKAGEYTQFIDEISQNAVRSTPYAVPNDWLTKIDQFIQGLRKLDSTKQLTEQNILNLLKPSTMQDAVTGAGILSQAELRVELLPSLNVESSMRSEVRSESEDKANEEKLEIAGKQVFIQWSNDKGIPFDAEESLDQKVIKSHLENLLKSAWRFQQVTKNVFDFEASLNEIEKAHLNYVATGAEKHVFRLALYLNEEAQKRYGSESISIRMALKTLRASQQNAEIQTEKIVEYLNRAGWTNLVPKIGGHIGSVYYEEWIQGPTVEDVTDERTLTPLEIEKISETWIRLGHELSDPGTYNRYPIDIHAGNIMYRHPSLDPDFVIVDGFGYDIDGDPLLVLRDLISYYVTKGKEKYNLENVEPVFRAAQNVLDPAEAQRFLIDALVANPVVQNVESALLQLVEDFLVKHYTLRGPPIAYAKAKVIVKALQANTPQLDQAALSKLTANRKILNIKSRRELEKIYAYFKMEQKPDWNQFKLEHSLTESADVIRDLVHLSRSELRSANPLKIKAEDRYDMWMDYQNQAGLSYTELESIKNDFESLVKDIPVKSKPGVYGKNLSGPMQEALGLERQELTYGENGYLQRVIFVSPAGKTIVQQVIQSPEESRPDLSKTAPQVKTESVKLSPVTETISEKLKNSAAEEIELYANGYYRTSDMVKPVKLEGENLKQIDELFDKKRGIKKISERSTEVISVLVLQRMSAENIESALKRLRQNSETFSNEDYGIERKEVTFSGINKNQYSDREVKMLEHFLDTTQLKERTKRIVIYVVPKKPFLDISSLENESGDLRWAPEEVVSSQEVVLSQSARKSIGEFLTSTRDRGLHAQLRGEIKKLLSPDMKSTRRKHGDFKGLFDKQIGGATGFRLYHGMRGRQLVIVGYTVATHDTARYSEVSGLAEQFRDRTLTLLSRDQMRDFLKDTFDITYVYQPSDTSARSELRDAGEQNFNQLKEYYRELDQQNKSKIGTFRKDGVFEPSDLSKVKEIMEQAGLKTGEKFVDLGSGDGRIAMLAAISFGAQATGFESDPELFRVSQKAQAELKGLGIHEVENVEFANSDFLKADLANADVLFYYDGGSSISVNREASKKFLDRLKTEMKPGSRLVLYKGSVLVEPLSRLFGEPAYQTSGDFPNYIFINSPARSEVRSDLTVKSLMESYADNAFVITVPSVSNQDYGILARFSETVQMLKDRNWYLRGKDEKEITDFLQNRLDNFNPSWPNELRKLVTMAPELAPYQIRGDDILTLGTFGSFWYEANPSPATISDLDILIVVAKPGVHELDVKVPIPVDRWFKPESQRKVNTVQLMVISQEYFTDRNFLQQSDNDGNQLLYEAMFRGNGIILRGKDYWQEKTPAYNLLKAIRSLELNVLLFHLNRIASPEKREASMAKTRKRWNEIKSLFQVLFSESYLSDPSPSPEIGLKRIETLDEQMQEALQLEDTPEMQNRIRSILAEASRLTYTQAVETALEKRLSEELASGKIIALSRSEVRNEKEQSEIEKLEDILNLRLHDKWYVLARLVVLRQQKRFRMLGIQPDDLLQELAVYLLDKKNSQKIVNNFKKNPKNATSYFKQTIRNRVSNLYDHYSAQKRSPESAVPLSQLGNPNTGTSLADAIQSSEKGPAELAELSDEMESIREIIDGLPEVERNSIYAVADVGIDSDGIMTHAFSNAAAALGLEGDSGRRQVHRTFYRGLEKVHKELQEQGENQSRSEMRSEESWHGKVLVSRSGTKRLIIYDRGEAAFNPNKVITLEQDSRGSRIEEIDRSRIEGGLAQGTVEFSNSSPEDLKLASEIESLLWEAAQRNVILFFQGFKMPAQDLKNLVLKTRDQQIEEALKQFINDSKTPKELEETYRASIERAVEIAESPLSHEEILREQQKIESSGNAWDEVNNPFSYELALFFRRQKMILSKEHSRLLQNLDGMKGKLMGGEMIQEAPLFVHQEGWIQFKTAVIEAVTDDSQIREFLSRPEMVARYLNQNLVMQFIEKLHRKTSVAGEKQSKALVRYFKRAMENEAKNPSKGKINTSRFYQDFARVLADPGQKKDQGQKREGEESQKEKQSRKERPKPQSEASKKAPTFYDILGVSKKAPLEEIKKSFRDLVKIYHPDRKLAHPGYQQGEMKTVDLEYEFKQVKEAYDVLSDPAKRVAYDRKISRSEVRLPPSLPAGRDGQVRESKVEEISFLEILNVPAFPDRTVLTGPGLQKLKLYLSQDSREKLTQEGYKSGQSLQYYIELSEPENSDPDTIPIWKRTAELQLNLESSFGRYALRDWTFLRYDEQRVQFDGKRDPLTNVPEINSLDEWLKSRQNEWWEKGNAKLSARSEVRKEIEIEGPDPDQPIRLKLSKNLLERIKEIPSWDISPKKGKRQIKAIVNLVTEMRKMTPRKALRLYIKKGSSLGGPWLFKHFSNLADQLELTPEEMKHVIYFELDNFDDIVGNNVDMDIFSRKLFYYYWIINLLVFEQSLETSFHKTSAMMAHRELINQAYAVILSDLEGFYRIGKDQELSRDFMEPRLIELAQNQPKLSGVISRFLENLELWQNQGSEISKKTMDYLFEARGDAGDQEEIIKKIKKSIVLSEELYEFTAALQPKTEQQLQAWDHPLEYLVDLAKDREIAILDDIWNLQLSEKQFRNHLHFNLNWLSEMEQLGYRQWGIITSAHLYSIFLWLYEMDQTVSYQELHQRVKDFMSRKRGKGALSFRTALMLPRLEEPLHVTRDIHFWESLWNLKEKLNLDISLFSNMRDGREELNSWAEKSKKNGKFLLMSSEIGVSEREDMLSDMLKGDLSHVLWVKKILARENYDGDRFTWGHAMAYAGAHIGTKRGWGDYESGAVPFRDNKLLSNFVAKQDLWFQSHFPDVDAALFISNSDTDPEEEFLDPEEIDSVNPEQDIPRGSPSASRSEVRNQFESDLESIGQRVMVMGSDLANMRLDFFPVSEEEVEADFLQVMLESDINRFRNILAQITADYYKKGGSTKGLSFSYLKSHLMDLKSILEKYQETKSIGQFYASFETMLSELNKMETEGQKMIDSELSRLQEQVERLESKLAKNRVTLLESYRLTGAKFILSMQSPSRSEVRTNDVARDVVAKFLGNDASQDPELAKKIRETVAEVGVEEFGVIVKQEALLRLAQIEAEKKSAVDSTQTQTVVQINKEMAEQAVNWFVDVLTSKVKGSLAIGFDSTENLQSLTEALQNEKVRGMIGVALLPQSMKNLATKGFNVQFVNKFESYRPMFSVENGKAVPVVGEKSGFESGQNPSLFYVGVDNANIQHEPFLEVAEKILQITSALLMASRIKKASDLTNLEELNRIKPELLKDLFDNYAESGKVIRFDAQGNMMIDRAFLLKFITEYLAEQKIEAAA